MYIFAVLGIIFLVLLFAVKNPPEYIVPGNLLFMAVSMGLFVIQTVREMGMVKFAEINPTHIEWIVNDKNKPHVLVEWNDVQWIKKENNGYISFFRASSFCDSLRIDHFSEKDQEELTALVIEYARQRNIRLVNFLEPSLATV